MNFMKHRWLATLIESIEAEAMVFSHEASRPMLAREIMDMSRFHQNKGEGVAKRSKFHVDSRCWKVTHPAVCVSKILSISITSIFLRISNCGCWPQKRPCQVDCIDTQDFHLEHFDVVLSEKGSTSILMIIYDNEIWWKGNCKSNETAENSLK